MQLFAPYCGFGLGQVGIKIVSNNRVYRREA